MTSIIQYLRDCEGSKDEISLSILQVGRDSTLAYAGEMLFDDINDFLDEYEILSGIIDENGDYV